MSDEEYSQSSGEDGVEDLSAYAHDFAERAGVDGYSTRSVEGFSKKSVAGLSKKSKITIGLPAPSDKSLASTQKSTTTLKTKSGACKARDKKKGKRCFKLTQLDCENEAPWKTYMKMRMHDVQNRKAAEEETWGEFPRKHKSSWPPLWPELPTLPASPCCDPLKLPDPAKPDEVPCGREPSEKESSICSWPKLWACTNADVVREQKVLLRKLRLKNMGALPCEIEEIDSPDSSEDEDMQEMAALKELVHPRIPLSYPKKLDVQMVDQSTGESPGLVFGDYTIFDFESKKGDHRTYATVTLRGLVGMHMVELEREREKSWKFCLFQGLVALLAKTQLRYKFAWSANIDYIYQHAWELFVHIGFLGLRDNLRFDDMLVYNYTYSVELELVDKLEGVPIVPIISFKYVETTLQKQRYRSERKELTLLKTTIGDESTKDAYKVPVHAASRMLEKWFNKLDDRYTNCIMRTSRFSIAFWQDGSFWYTYNPYRCDKIGFWNDNGAACISKFCSKDSLRRHLMILVLRAYAFDSATFCDKQKKLLDYCTSQSCAESSIGHLKTFSVQMYQIIFHSCRIHNVKLYQRSPRKPKTPMVEKQESDPCAFDPLVDLEPKPCQNTNVEEEVDPVQELEQKMEKTYWLRNKQIMWSKRSCHEVDENGKQKDNPKWHNYEVIKSRRLFVLRGELHISDKRFDEKNRNRQAGACYAVSAGMVMISAPEYWDDKTLDVIVVCGDSFYTSRRPADPKPSNPLNPPDVNDDEWDAQPKGVYSIDVYQFEIEAQPAIEGRLFDKSSRCLWRSLESFFGEHCFGILSCESARLGLFKSFGAYYALDVRSYGPPVYPRGQGGSYLLRSSCLGDLVTCVVLLVGSPECSPFQIRPLRVLSVKRLEDDPCEPKADEPEEKCEPPKPAECPNRKKPKSKKPGPPEKEEKTKTICLRKQENKPCYEPL